MRRSSLKEWGRSRRRLLMFLIFSGVFGARRSEASGSRLGRSPTAWRPEGLDAGAVRRRLWATEEISWLLRGVLGRAALSSSGTGVPVFGQALRLPVIPSPRRGGMKRFDGLWSAGSITWGDHASGGHDLHDLAPTSL